MMWRTWLRVLASLAVLLPAIAQNVGAVAARGTQQFGTANLLIAAAQTSTPAPTLDSPLTGLPQPTPVPSPPSFGTLDHAIVFDNGAQVILATAAGSSLAGLANMSDNPGPFKRPRYAGWQFMYYDHGFILGDDFGHHVPVPAPTAPGEQVYDTWPSPDGAYIAWVLVSPAPWNGAMFSMGASRIVLTDQQGANARVLLSQHIDAAGGVPIIYGWRWGKPPTLLVQYSYGFVGLHKGLEEFDPETGDLVGDWLPPTGDATLPAGEVLDLSPDGSSIVYATSDVTFPSGEGPFPADLNVMTLAGRRSVQVDVAASHQDRPHGLPAPAAYAFSREAFISPDGTRVAYTRLDAIYPRGAPAPTVRPIAAIANADGTGKSDLRAGYQVMGWVDNQTLVLQKDESPNLGLYLFDLRSGSATLIANGSNLRVDGIVP